MAIASEISGLCVRCKVRPAHPLYQSHCVDCYLDGAEERTLWSDYGGVGDPDRPPVERDETERSEMDDG